MTYPFNCISSTNSLNPLSIEVVENKISHLTEDLCQILGYKIEELLNNELDKIIKLPKHEISNILNKEISFKQVELINKWEIPKKIFLISFITDIGRNILIIKNQINDFDLLAIHNFTKSYYFDKTTRLQTKQNFLSNNQEKRNFFAACIDIKNFGSISSYYGEEFADEVLKIIANRLIEIFQKENIYKLHSDLFCIIQKDCDFKNIHEFVAISKQKIKQIFSKNFNINNYTLNIEYTVGIGFGDVKSIFDNTLMALKYAKNSSNNFYIFDDKIYLEKQSDFLNEIDMLTKIKAAIEEDRITPFYQPIIDNETMKVTKYECLARIREPNGNYLAPNTFIPIAQKYNLNNEITKKMILKSFEYFKDKEATIDFSINLTIGTLKDVEMHQFIIKQVEAFPRPERIIFEVVESEAMPLELFENNILIQELKRRKCKFALDDFGSGYSNLTMLTYFNYDYLKIDGSLITTIDKKETFKSIKTIVELAHLHNVKVVAEWVSNQETLKKVKELGIDYSQGFLIGLPNDTLKIHIPK